MLFKTNTELTERVTVMLLNTDLKTLRPAIKREEFKLAKELLGAEQYQELHQAYQSDELSTEQALLLDHVQDTLAHYVAARNLDSFGIKAGENGLTNSTGEKFEQAPEQRIFFAKRDLFNAADEFAEILLNFLEQNESDYPLWAKPENPTYTKNNNLLIRNADQLTAYCSLAGGSRRVYLALLPQLRYVERRLIETALGAEFLEWLKNPSSPSSPKPEAAKLLELLREAESRLAFAAALPEMQVEIRDGLLLMSSFSSPNKQEAALTAAHLAQIKEQYRSTGADLLLEARDYANDNAEIFPIFKNSKYFKKPQAPPNFNHADGKIFKF